jgi:hypothetical protein
MEKCKKKMLILFLFRPQIFFLKKARETRHKKSLALALSYSDTLAMT